MQLRFRDAAVSWRETTYTCIKKLGEGGASSVYMMTATSGATKGELFAVKFFDALDKPPDWHLAFMKEVHFLRGCNHPSIVKVFDEGRHLDRHPFVVMELMQGSLKDLYASERRLNDGQKLCIITQLLSALNYLARLDPPGVHRDIKPQNILFNGMTCLLGDFGLVFLRHTDATPEDWEQLRNIPMAQNYRTPELIPYARDGTPLPPASDVFQLGLVAAELFTGVNPLKPGGGLKRVELNPVAEVPGRYSVPIKALLQDMLEIDARQRITAADALGRWQELFLNSYRGPGLAPVEPGGTESG